MSDDEDYMSDAFLNSLEKQDVRPGLCYGTSKRELDQQKKREATQPRKRQELEDEALEKGLQTSLDAKNKGFQLLYKPGVRNVGLFEQTGPPVARKPRTEPPLLIPISIKSDRLGLGPTVPKIRVNDPRTMKVTDVAVCEFREKERAAAMSRFLYPDLCSSQKTCYHLDSEKGLKEPVEEYFWPAKVMLSLQPKTEEEEEGEAAVRCKTPDTPEQVAYKLQTLTHYLRSQYLYCVWCGMRFESEAELEAECGGDSRAQHD